MHGHLTELGYGPAAMCADCHGAHDIRPLSDPASQLSASQRLATCAKCHPNASPNFASFDPHADHRDPQRSLLLNAVYTVLLTFLCTTFGFFGLHSVLWFLRSLVDVLQHGRPQGLVPGAPAYVRFTSRHRVAHTFMVLSFLGLAATGLPLKYSHCQWAQTLAAAFGGFESTSTWHRLFGVVNIALLVSHVFWLLGRWVVARRNGASPLSLVFGPDSPVPNWRDVKDFQNMLRWLVGQGRKPTFERWAYWEKYDFWGACADIVAIGSTGLVLWFPNLFCTFLPGETLNIAKVIHSTQALLATGFVFAIHFFNTHVRPEKFPMDLSVLTGLISEHEAEEERPDFLERMRRAGRLEELRTTVPARSRILLITFGGTCALVVGLALLAGIVLPMFSK
jgi:cytochrome b subunit of formate dehydrogenase